MLYINVNNIFFKSYSVDPVSGHAIYVFDSTYLPSSDEIADKQVYDLLIDKLMDKLITKIPSAPFILVVFSSGFLEKKISWVYGIKMFSKLPKELRAQLQKTYIVHESFFIKTVYQVLTNALNIKNLGNNALLDFNQSKNSLDSLQNASIIHVTDLTDLSALVDITRLRISLNVYLYDYQFSEYIDVPKEYFNRLSAVGTRQYRQLIFDKIFRRLELDAIKVELIFQRPGSYKRVNILLDVIERNNYIDLSQWDIYSLATVFLHFLKHKSLPLIPIDLITLPISDDFEYTYATFCSIIKHNQYYELLETIFPLFISQLKHSEVTKHDARSLSKALCPQLCQEKISMMSADRLAVGTRFIRNLLEHFPAITQRIDRARLGIIRGVSPIKRVDRVKQDARPTSPKPLSQPQPPKPRKLIVKTPSDKFTAARPAQLVPPPKKSTMQEKPIILEKPTNNPNDSRECLSSSTTMVGENSSTSVLKHEPHDDIRSRSTSLAASTEIINQMVKDDQLGDTNNDCDTNVSQLAFDDKNASIQKNQTIFHFDRQLQSKRKTTVKNEDNKFSREGYSDIKAGSKVSKLAALYEERLQGLQAIQEIKQKGGYS